MTDVTDYTDLITSEHRNRALYPQTIEALVQPSVDLQTMLQQVPALYDLDTAVGVQLDAVGEWVGQSRRLQVPLTGVYFSFDIAGLGFDEGTWQGPFDPSTGLELLPDDSYRTLLRAKIAANVWDGTIPGAYAVWDVLFTPIGVNMFIVDNGDMTMYTGFAGGPFDAVTYELMIGGYLELRPMGVLMLGYIFTSVPDAPMFGFDLDNEMIAGFDVGAFATIVIP